MGLVEWLGRFPDRCSAGFSLEHQHPSLCKCEEAGLDEWSIFRTALRTATRSGIVHQADVRPLIRGRIAPKHVGTLYRRAKAEGMIREAGHERSDDLVGRNAGRLEPFYEVVAA
jgi:hypothetical protein